MRFKTDENLPVDVVHFLGARPRAYDLYAWFPDTSAIHIDPADRATRFNFLDSVVDDPSFPAFPG